MPQTNRTSYLKKVKLDPNESYSISDLSKVSKVPVSILQQVYNRGIGAHKSNLGSVRLKKDFSKNPSRSITEAQRLSPEQWAMARVYSFLNKGTTYKTTDKDLALKAGY
jgi:hypothetical protein